MKKTELPNCPQWLLDAKTKNENVVWNDPITQDYIIWKGGTWEYGYWKGGTWEYGYWKGGTWKGGIWENGTWEYGYWKDGTWKDGYWENGYWKDGTWKGGIWENGIWENGIWENGYWKDGTWKDGTWKDGIWENGYWENGYKSIGVCKWIVYYNSTKKSIKIGCKENTLKYWIDWFNSKNEFETKRNTEEFKLIHKAFLMAKAAIEIENME